MAKDKNKKKKEELIKMLDELSNSDNIPEETKEKVGELLNHIEEIRCYSKAEIIFAHILSYGLIFAIDYLIGLSLIGFFSDYLLIENRAYVLLIPLGIGIVSLLISFISNLFKIGLIPTFILRVITQFSIFISLNFMYPIFEFASIWIFYIAFVLIIKTYVIYRFGKWRIFLWKVFY